MLRQALAARPTQNIWVIGHSRGGALAEFAALDVVANATDLGLQDPAETVKLVRGRAAGSSWHFGAEPLPA